MSRLLGSALAALAISVLGSAGARAACDCATAGAAPYCSGSSVSISSPAGENVTISLDSSYQCGQYATGDFWVVGKGSPQVVKVTGTTPGWDGKRNGWDANRPFNQQHMESRGITPNFSGAPSLPSGGYNVSSGPVSFMKAVGRPQTSIDATRYVCTNGGDMRESCVKFSPVITFIPNVPDSDGDGRTDDEFRPGPTGVTKIGPYRVDMLEARVAALPKLSTSAVPNRNDYSFEKIRSRFGKGCAITYASDNIIQMIAATDCLWEATYGNAIAVHNRTIPLRFLLADFDWNNPVHKGALIAYIQHGIDIAQHVSQGWRTISAPPPTGTGYLYGEGGILVGHKDPAVFAAHMLNQPAIRSAASGFHFYESDQIYRSSVDNRVYYGKGSRGTNHFCPDNGSGTEGGVHCYHPSKQMDAGCGGSPKSYQSQVSNSAPYTELWVRILGAQSAWNDEAWLAFYKAWYDGGRAPGHTQFLWSSVAGSTSCNNQRYNTGFTSIFGDQMRAAFKGLGSTPPPPSPPPPSPPPPEPLPAPQQL
jgi:hypothetical protein